MPNLSSTQNNLGLGKMSKQAKVELKNRVESIKQTISRLRASPRFSKDLDSLMLLRANTEDIESILARLKPGVRFDAITKEIVSQLTETEQFLEEIETKNTQVSDHAQG